MLFPKLRRVDTYHWLCKVKTYKTIRFFPAFMWCKTCTNAHLQNCKNFNAWRVSL